MAKETRARLLSAALDLFAERGYHGVAVPEITRRAGVAAGTLYRHFESKDELVNAVFISACESVKTNIWEGFPHNLPVREAFHEYWTRAARLVRRVPQMATFLMMHYHGDYLNDRSRQLSYTIDQEIIAILVRGQKQKLFWSIPEGKLFSIYGGLFSGFVRASLMTNDWSYLIEGEQFTWDAMRRRAHKKGDVCRHR